MARKKPPNLIVTVATSLIESLKRLPNSADAFYQSIGDGAQNIEWPIIRRISQSYRSCQWKAPETALRGVPDTARLCGAEINSIAALNRKDWLNLRNITIFVSDTLQGEQTGEMRKAYTRRALRNWG